VIETTICRGCGRVIGEDGVPLAERGDVDSSTRIRIALCRECRPAPAPRLVPSSCEHPSRRKAWERGRDFVLCETCGAEVEW
jgi:hypothetical protein